MRVRRGLFGLDGRKAIHVIGEGMEMVWAGEQDRTETGKIG